MTQKERQERSRHEIYCAALEEFGTQEYDRVSMEQICSRHGISKGMMYHYYSNKDELFLLCVQETFQMLREHVEREAAALDGQDASCAIKAYFVIRENFFRSRPRHKRIFETAMLRPPEHLEDQIQTLHKPLRSLNNQFLDRVVAQMPLRAGLSREQVTRYLGCMEELLYPIMVRYQAGQMPTDLHAMLDTAEQILDMILFGVVRPVEQNGGL